MPTITVRNVPELLLEKVRALSRRERRSMSKEFLVVLEEGVEHHQAAISSRQTCSSFSPAAQAGAWKALCGEWKDSRKTSEIVDDIRQHRSMGREVSL